MSGGSNSVRNLGLFIFFCVFPMAGTLYAGENHAEIKGRKQEVVHEVNSKHLPPLAPGQLITCGDYLAYSPNCSSDMSLRLADGRAIGFDLIDGAGMTWLITTAKFVPITDVKEAIEILDVKKVGRIMSAEVVVGGDDEFSWCVASDDVNRDFVVFALVSLWPPTYSKKWDECVSSSRAVRRAWAMNKRTGKINRIRHNAVSCSDTTPGACGK